MNRIWNNKGLLKVLGERYVEAQSKKGIKFEYAKQYWKAKKPLLENNKKQIENTSIEYPAYFTAPIHTYEKGHLNWDQAYQTSCHMEGSALMSVMDITGDPCFQCSPEEAYTIYKSYIVDNIKQEFENINIRYIVDLGCGTGETTHLLSLNYPEAYVLGIDLSPNYLSIGTYKYSNDNIQWKHANMEYTELQDDSVDVVIVCYSFHEMIPEAIKGAIQEIYRILRHGGKVINIDMDSEKLPRFPSFIDISEPHLQEYRNVRILDQLCTTGFIKYERKHLYQMSSLFVATKS